MRRGDRHAFVRGREVVPTYFDPDSPTDAQQSRWDWTVVENERVWRANVERQGRSFDENERSEMGLSVGHPKSRLFARLLDSKAALPFPPPKSFSYPWYEVIEEPGPHQAHARLGRVFLQRAAGGTGAHRPSLMKCPPSGHF